jgi:outer membrane protein assembly factor BamB
MPNHDAQATRFNGAEQGIGVGNVAHLHPVWMLPITTGPAPVASGNHLFTPLDASMGSSARGSLGLAVQDSPTGRTVRRFSMTALHLPSHDVLATLAFADGKLLVSDLGDPVTHPVHPAMLLAIDVHSGRIVWRVQTPASWLTIAGKIIYTGFDSSSAIDLRTGRILWRHRGAFAAPVVVGGRLYQAERVGDTVQMQVYVPRTGRLLATLPRLSDARVTGDSHTVYAVHVDLSGRSWLGRIGSRGKAAWKVDLGPLQFSAQPVLAYHTLYVPANREGAGVMAVRAADGHILWQARSGPNVSLIAANNLLFALHRPGLRPNPHLDGHIDVLNAHTGRLLRRLDMTPYLQRHGLSSASLDDLAISGGTVFLYGHSVFIALHP